MSFPELPTHAPESEAGDALEILYRTHERFFVAIARDVLGGASEARECVHDVFVRLLKTPQRYDAMRGSLKSFVTVAVRNEAISRLRRRKRERAYLSVIAPRSEETPDDATAAVRRTDVNAALGVLSNDQRSAVLLAYFAHLTHVEIAERLHVPLGTVKSRISTAIRRLHDILVDDDE